MLFWIALKCINKKHKCNQTITSKDLNQELNSFNIVIINNINFLVYANIINADYQLNFDIIVTLWEELVTNGQTQAEKDLIYKWF